MSEASQKRSLDAPNKKLPEASQIQFQKAPRNNVTPLLSHTLRQDSPKMFHVYTFKRIDLLFAQSDKNKSDASTVPTFASVQAITLPHCYRKSCVKSALRCSTYTQHSHTHTHARCSLWALKDVPRVQTSVCGPPALKRACFHYGYRTNLMLAQCLYSPQSMGTETIYSQFC